MCKKAGKISVEIKAITPKCVCSANDYKFSDTEDLTDTDGTSDDANTSIYRYYI